MSWEPIPLGQSSTDALLQLINRDNSTPEFTLALTSDDVEFGTPAIASVGWPRNTTLVISAVEGSGYEGEITVYYNRIDIGEFFQNTLAIIIGGPEVITTHAALERINQTYGLMIGTDDIVDEFIPNGAGSFTFRATDTSLVWTGEVLIYIIDPGAGGIDLGDDIVEPNLGSLPLPV